MSENRTNETAKKVTASDVAARAGVSKWTVSRAFTEGASISPRSRERVLKAAKELGYRPNLLARSLSQKRTNIVGVVVDDLANPHKLIMIDEVTRQLQRKGLMAMMLNITPDHTYTPALSLADQFQVDGLIFLGNVLTDELLKLAREIRHIPLVVLGRDSRIPDIQVINTDGYQAGREIAELLLEQGHRRFGYMAGPVSESTQLDRLQGYRDRLEEAGAELSEILEAGCYSRSRGYQVMTEYLGSAEEERCFSALFCENDILAIGALDALQQRGDSSIAVVGFDDIELADAPSYSLTTFRQPMEKLVASALQRLEQEPDHSYRETIAGELVLRASHLCSRTI